MKQFLAYDGINNHWELFNTIEEARDYLEEIFLDPNNDSYHPDLASCKIYQLVETVEYEIIDSKKNYKYFYDDDIPIDAEDHEIWPYDDMFDELWQHKFVPIAQKEMNDKKIEK